MSSVGFSRIFRVVCVSLSLFFLSGFGFYYDPVFSGVRSSWNAFTEGTEYYYMAIEVDSSFSKKDIELRVKGRILMLSAEKDERKVNVNLSLPSNADPDKIEAELDDGVLRLKIRKYKPNPGKVIKVD